MVKVHRDVEALALALEVPESLNFRPLYYNSSLVPRLSIGGEPKYEAMIGHADWEEQLPGGYIIGFATVVCTVEQCVVSEAWVMM